MVCSSCSGVVCLSGFFVPPQSFSLRGFFGSSTLSPLFFADCSAVIPGGVTNLIACWTFFAFRWIASLVASATSSRSWRCFRGAVPCVGREAADDGIWSYEPALYTSFGIELWLSIGAQKSLWASAPSSADLLADGENARRTASVGARRGRDGSTMLSI